MPVTGIDDLKALQQKISQLLPNTQKAMVRKVENDSVLLSDINRGYLEFGIKPDGSEIQPRGYSKSYISYKLQFARHKNISYVDLKFDGHFHASITFEHVQGKNFRIKSIPNQAYFKDLFDRYGELVGINQKDMDEYVNKTLMPFLEKEIAKQVA